MQCLRFLDFENGYSARRSEARSRRAARREKFIESVDLYNFCEAASCEGWYVYRQRQCLEKKIMCFLWNPHSLEKIVLPNLQIPPSKCILAAPPTKPQCLVFFFYKHLPRVLFCRPGDTKWTSFAYVVEGRLSSLCDAVSCAGKVYVFNLLEELGEFEVYPQLRFKRYNARLPAGSLIARVQLVDSRGELFLVRRKSIIDIEVFKMDFSQDRWERVSNLSPDHDTSFFLIGNYSVSLSATRVGNSISGNTIYFTDEADMYSLSLPEKRLSVWRSNPDSGLRVLHDQMMPKLRFSDKPRCSKQEDKKIHEDDGIIEESSDDDRIIEESIDEYNSDDENKSECIWFELPADLQIVIAQHLPTVLDYMNFRATCRKWRSLILPIRWKVNHEGVPYKYPLFMFSTGEKGKYNLYNPIARLMHCIDIPELEECQVRFSDQGWLLVTKASRFIFFFEPFTRTKIQLPNLRIMDQVDGFCFSDTPTSSNWQIFGIGHSDHMVIKVVHLRSGDEKWTLRTVISERLPYHSFANPVFDGECFCYLGENGSLIFFKFTETYFSWYIESSASRHFFNSWRRFLISYKNELISVFFDKGRWTHVLNFDRKDHKWVEIKGLEKEILYLSQTTSLIVDAAEQNIKNTIQFSIFRDIDDDSSNISYSLENQIYQIYKRDEGCSPIADLYNSKEFLFGTWIQPLLVTEMLTAV